MLTIYKYISHILLAVMAMLLHSRLFPSFSRTFWDFLSDCASFHTRILLCASLFGNNKLVIVLFTICRFKIFV